MQACFLLGPAGSGKTFRCLTEIRDALSGAPEGAPLILLAPKQTTFQLERQLLTGGALPGYTRLRILSFERLAQFVLEHLSVTPPGQLNDEGRVMVLRALLLRHEGELKLFRQSARRPGFAQELGQLLGELQQHQLTPAKLRALGQRPDLRRELQDKLHDLALLQVAYASWLDGRELQDASCLLDTATAALGRSAKDEGRSTEPDVSLRPLTCPLHISQLWLDGFAEMTPQELDLLTAFLPYCQRATLAFCLENEAQNQDSWLSIWSSVGQTFRQCRERLASLPDIEISLEWLRRNPAQGRFQGNPVFQQIEAQWQAGVGAVTGVNGELRMVACANPDAEARFVAREILGFVQAGGRFRDAAVLLRDLEMYHRPLERAFRRHDIPFFLDRRESVSHHPLAELTRGALRTVAFDWGHDDWFAALKAGFAPVAETEIDRLENEALARGWRGAQWREPFPTDDVSLESLRKKILPPFEKFAEEIGRSKKQPAGRQLAGALRELWNDLGVETILTEWSQAGPESPSPATQPSSLHLTVWEQMNAWLDNVALAFANEALPLREWLPVLEAGLANLTVGVIPPVIDQVLIGAVDRSRNPDLKFAFVLGVNDSVFPAAPAAPALLTNADRDDLESCSVMLGPNVRQQLARERYLGYIACTRASQKLAVTFSRRDAAGKILNPSPFITQLQRLFPGLEVENLPPDVDWRQARHVNEMVPPLVQIQNAKSPDRDWQDLLELPALKLLAESLHRLREPDMGEGLSPALAEAIYGRTLRASVSRLEEFAACPLRFFVHSGLRAEERKVFELDARERGSFQHEVLKKFHDDLMNAGRRWRDVTPADARERVARIAAGLEAGYRDGLLRTDGRSRFAARVLTESLQNFVETLVAWMRGQYDFDPAVAELEFGFDTDAPAWEMDLGDGHKLALRGRIDRIDLCRDGEEALCVVTDYKSSQRKLDQVLVEHGVQLQLLAYLAAARQWTAPRALRGVKRLIPAGVFYVNLRGQFENGDTRTGEGEDPAVARRRAYRHTGRFDASALARLDSAGAADQFNYRLNADGGLRSDSTEALPRAEFEKLLDGVETQLKQMGRAIFSGRASVDPYRKGGVTACEFCDYSAACRIDPWTHAYRVLRADE